MKAEKLAIYRDQMLDKLQGRLSPEASDKLNQAISRKPELQVLWKEVKEVHEKFEGQQPDYSPFFAAKVMQKLEEAPPATAPKLMTGFKWVGIPALALILGLLAFTAWQEKSLDFETLSGTEEVSLENMLIVEWTHNVEESN